MVNVKITSPCIAGSKPRVKGDIVKLEQQEAKLLCWMKKAVRYSKPAPEQKELPPAVETAAKKKGPGRPPKGKK